jgi:hypothetical protein
MGLDVNIKDVIFLCYFYGCEILSLVIKEEYIFRVFEFRVHNEELVVRTPLNIKKSTRMRWVVHVAYMEEMRIAYKI